jgi:hypothetical protein
MNYIITFFDSPFFVVVGGLATIAMIAGSVYTAYLVITGILPVWYRLGIGLSKRKIAIFASSEFESLKSMLVDSKIFASKNIIQININDIVKAEKESIFLVHWKDYKDKMGEIIKIKKDSTALVVYAPQSEGRIEDPTVLDSINSHRNSIIVNFRGRLLNDILVSLITTSYDIK